MALRLIFGVVITATLLTSCSRKNNGAVHPVRGSVLSQYGPASGARVVFHPLGNTPAGQPFPQATVEADGSFQLSSYKRHDGAPPGRYAVTIQWPSDSVKEEDGTPAGPDRLGRRYADPNKTPLQVEIRTGRNDLEPFRVN